MRVALFSDIHGNMLGLRRDGLSAYTLLESEDHSLVVRQFQVPYDAAEEARLNVQRGVPRP